MTSTEGRDGGEAWFVGATEKKLPPLYWRKFETRRCLGMSCRPLFLFVPKKRINLRSRRISRNYLWLHWPSCPSFRTENQGKIFCPFAILPRGKSASLFFRESVSSWGKDRSRREIEGCTRVAFPFAISVIMLSSSSRRTLEGVESNRLPWLGGLRTATWKGEINQRTQRPFCSSLSFDERNGSKPWRPFVFD